jgi:hypothetical protein
LDGLKTQAMVEVALYSAQRGGETVEFDCFDLHLGE